MRKIIFTLFAFLLVGHSNAQNINFLDANFKMKLLQSDPSNFIAQDFNDNYIQIDTNNDGEIGVSEALNVKALDVSNTEGVNVISSLSEINYFENLVFLDCSYNNLSEIQLNLPNLTGLMCSYNSLTGIIISNPSLLTGLEYKGNQITNLNLLQFPNLQHLDCSSNQILNLNIGGLTNLNYLYCNNNQLASLDVSSLVNLTSFNCSYNQITSLNLTNLQQINCLSNQLSTLLLPYNPSVIITNLNCGMNLLTSLEVPNVRSLSCFNNSLTTLNFLFPQTLNTILCHNNSLTSLDLSQCDANSISNVKLMNNLNLEYLNLKNGRNNVHLALSGSLITPGLHIENCPNLRYICVDEGMETDEFVNGLSSLGLSSQINLNSYCSFVPGGEYFTIQGSNKYDSNNDGCGVSDYIFPNLRFNITNGTNNGTLISNASGNYFVPVVAGVYTVTPIMENPTYFVVFPSNAVIDFPTQSSPFVQNFCLTANEEHSDLEVNLLPLAPARPGFDVIYKLFYKNKGTSAQSGTVNLVFNDAVLDFVAANQILTNQTVNNLSWDFTNLQPFETREITITLNINSPTELPSVNNGDLLSYSAIITSAATDETPDDNTFAFNQTVVNSYDPNDKTCLEGATIAPSEVGKYVHYLIRFENNGTANAHNIVVKDMIDTAKFDINSLVSIKGSHSFVTNITSGNKVEFIFENINLPFDDANNDGYVAFKIKTKPTLVTGNTFSNSANIYFDYNFPIVTNMAVTTIQALSTQDFAFGTYFTLYPNPVNNVLNIETKQAIEVSSVSIYNQLGQLVLVIPNAQNTKSVDVSSLSSGNYFIKINSDKGTSNTKFIKK